MPPSERLLNDNPHQHLPSASWWHCHGVGCCEHDGIDGMDVSAGDRARHMPQQAGDCRLVIAEVSGETGEAVAQHMRRDVVSSTSSRYCRHSSARVYPLAAGDLLRMSIGPFDHLDQNAPGPLTGCVGGPGRSMLANRIGALADRPGSDNTRIYEIVEPPCRRATKPATEPSQRSGGAELNADRADPCSRSDIVSRDPGLG